MTGIIFQTFVSGWLFIHLNIIIQLIHQWSKSHTQKLHQASTLLMSLIQNCISSILLSISFSHWDFGISSKVQNILNILHVSVRWNNSWLRARIYLLLPKFSKLLKLVLWNSCIECLYPEDHLNQFNSQVQILWILWRLLPPPPFPVVEKRGVGCTFCSPHPFTSSTLT